MMRRRLAYFALTAALLLAAAAGSCSAETPLRPLPGDPHAPVSPFAYRAVGDGLADDTAAVSAWLDSGRPLVCAGTFRIVQPIVVSAKNGLFLQGFGSQGCRLKLGAPGATLTVKLPNAPAISASRPEIVIHDVAFAIDAAMPSAALKIDAPATIDRVERGADLRDISFTPEGSEKTARICLELTDIVNVTISGLNCRGRERGYAADSSGLLIDGTHIPGEIIIHDADVYLMETGFRLEGAWQGVSIESSVCVACRVGVRGDGGHDGNEDWLRVLNSHFNVYDYGVFATNIFYTEIRGNLTFLNAATAPGYAHRDPPSPACYHFDMRTPTGAASVIRDNICDGYQRAPTPGITRYGVYVDGFAGSTTSQTDLRTENVFQNLDVGTMLGANARGVIVGPDIAVGVAVPKRSLAPLGVNAAVAPVPF